MSDDNQDDLLVFPANVHQCARCGMDHQQIQFVEFRAPIVDADGTIWNYWALCPTTNEPILMRKVEIENK